jgi:hypothetical protein
LSVKSIVFPSVLESPVNVISVTVTEDVPMNPMVMPPIHAATATLTATVTAMSIIEATTGLSAFLFFLIVLWIFNIFPPLFR